MNHDKHLIDMNCSRVIEKKGTFHYYYEDCPHKAKYLVSYNSGVNGKRIKDIAFCGKHLNSMKAWVKRMDAIGFHHNFVSKTIEI